MLSPANKNSSVYPTQLRSATFISSFTVFDIWGWTKKFSEPTKKSHLFNDEFIGLLLKRIPLLTIMSIARFDFDLFE